MEITAWNNGKHHESGAGYGFKITASDRDRYFQKSWKSVIVVLPGDEEVEVNVAKASFWTGTCRELINQRLGNWLIENGHAPWPKGQPPIFHLTVKGNRFFLSP